MGILYTPQLCYVQYSYSVQCVLDLMFLIVQCVLLFVQTTMHYQSFVALSELVPSKHVHVNCSERFTVPDLSKKQICHYGKPTCTPAVLTSFHLSHLSTCISTDQLINQFIM